MKITFELSDEMALRLFKACAEEDVSPSNYIELILDNKLTVPAPTYGFTRNASFSS